MRYVGIFLFASVAAILLLAGCETVDRVDKALAPPPPPPQPAEEFYPAYAAAVVKAGEGEYPDIFTPGTYALWVSPSVAETKYNAALQGGSPPAPELLAQAATLTRDFIVIECHLESAFGDSSIAYDTVGMKGMSVYLELPDGRKVKPEQRIIGNALEDEPKGALKQFRRTNLLIFPRRDLWVGAITLESGIPSVRLVLETNNTRSVFEWPDIKFADPTSIQPAQELSKIKMVELTFNDLFTQIRRLSHILD